MQAVQSYKLTPIPAIRHAFFGRAGGVSQGIYASLNCGPGSGDDPEAVEENRARAMVWLGAERDTLVTLHQIHSTEVQTFHRLPDPAAPRVRADALVTRQKGIVLGVLTADCAPILFVDAEAGVIGAAHAGWRGALGGIVEMTVQAMEALGARRKSIIAAIGPCIAQESYEVGAEFREHFLKHNLVNGFFFEPRDRETPKYFFDLPAYLISDMQRAKIGYAAWVQEDTYPQSQRFFSYRRATHRKEADYGRNLSAIMLTG